MSRKQPIPPIRVGSKCVTYTPPGPVDISRYNRLVFHCEILALYVDGKAVESIDTNRSYYRHDVRADLRLPDGTLVDRVPYAEQPSPDGSSWCRPYISSMRIR